MILNDAPPLLRFKALVEGIKVIVRDKKKLFYMITESFMELEDLFQFHFYGFRSGRLKPLSMISGYQADLNPWTPE